MTLITSLTYDILCSNIMCLRLAAAGKDIHFKFSNYFSFVNPLTLAKDSRLLLDLWFPSFL